MTRFQIFLLFGAGFCIYLAIASPTLAAPAQLGLPSDNKTINNETGWRSLELFMALCYFGIFYLDRMKMI